MECFYHSAAPAVGICKNCQRGVCRECAAEIADGIACSGRCESQAVALGSLLKQAEGSVALQAFFTTAMGLVFVALPLIDLASRGWELGIHHVITLIIGSVFLATGIAYSWKAYKGRRTRG